MLDGFPRYRVDNRTQTERRGNRVWVLWSAVLTVGHAFVFGTGALSFPPVPQLYSDVLVVPAQIPLSDN